MRNKTHHPYPSVYLFSGNITCTCNLFLFFTFYYTNYVWKGEILMKTMNTIYFVVVLVRTDRVVTKHAICITLSPSRHCLWDIAKHRNLTANHTKTSCLTGNNDMFWVTWQGVPRMPAASNHTPVRLAERRDGSRSWPPAAFRLATIVTSRSVTVNCFKSVTVNCFESYPDACAHSTKLMTALAQ